jgi:hypothetical protein
MLIKLMRQCHLPPPPKLAASTSVRFLPPCLPCVHSCQGGVSRTMVVLCMPRGLYLQPCPAGCSSC